MVDRVPLAAHESRPDVDFLEHAVRDRRVRWPAERREVAVHRVEGGRYGGPVRVRANSCRSESSPFPARTCAICR